MSVRWCKACRRPLMKESGTSYDHAECRNAFKRAREEGSKKPPMLRIQDCDVCAGEPHRASNTMLPCRHRYCNKKSIDIRPYRLANKMPCPVCGKVVKSLFFS